MVAVVDAVLGTALGLLVSAFADTEFQAVQFMPAVVIPQLLLCGLFVARDALPPVLEAISDVLPLSYAVDAMQALVGAADRGACGPTWRGRRVRRSRASRWARPPCGGVRPERGRRGVGSA